MVPCYFAVPKRIQKYVLLLFSVVFYLSFSVKAFVIMTFTGTIAYAAALLIHKAETQKRKLLLVLSITLELLQNSNVISDYKGRIV